MGRRTREHTVKIYQIKDGEVINEEFKCTHQDHAMDSIKEYGDYYIEVYDIVGNLIHSENKHLLEINEQPEIETKIEEPIKEVIEEQIIEEQIIEEKIETEVLPVEEIKVPTPKKAPVKKAAAKPATKKAITIIKKDEFAFDALTSSSTSFISSLP